MVGLKGGGTHMGVGFLVDQPQTAWFNEEAARPRGSPLSRLGVSSLKPATPRRPTLGSPALGRR